MKDADLRFYAAGSVSGTIEEVREIEWPFCAVQGGEAATRYLHGDEPVDRRSGPF
jgi:hypothetical protein